MSKAALKSSNTCTTTNPTSVACIMSLCTFNRAVSTEWPFFYDDWVPMHLAYARPLVQLNETIYAKISFVHMVDGRACTKGIRVYKQLERALATLLPESYTVDDNLKTGVTILFCLCFITREYCTTSSIPEHYLVLVFFLTREWKWYAPLFELRHCGFSTSNLYPTSNLRIGATW